MKIIDRYILRAFLFPLTTCLVAFSMLFIIFDLLEHIAKIIDAKVPVTIVLKYYGALLLPTLEYIVPASLMLGALYALWRLTRSNEIIAMQASGTSIHRVVAPFLIVGLLFSIVLAIAKETVGVEAYVWTTELRRNKFQTAIATTLEQLTFYNSADHRLWLVDQFEEDRPGHLRGVKITQERPDGSRICDWFADRADWLDGSWWFQNLRIQRYGEVDNPMGGPEPAAPGTDNYREIPGLVESPRSFVLEARDWEFFSTADMLRYLREHPNISEAAALQKRFDVHNRLAFPWACFIVTLFGIPTGAKTGRQNALAGILTAVSYFFAFYALMQVGVLVGKSGTFPPWLGAWLSNIVFLVSGLIMLIRLR